MSIAKKHVVLAVAAATLAAGGLTAQAAFAGEPNATARLKRATASIAGYSDAEVLELLLAAQGPIATAHPELVRVLGFSEAKPHTDDKALQQLISAYLNSDRAFHARTAVPLQSGDPVRVDEALRTFSSSFKAFIIAQRPGASGSSSDVAAQAGGWFYMGAYVAVYANALALANAAVYANAAVATNALATLVVVTWYLPDSHATSSFERDAFVKTLSDALA